MPSIHLPVGRQIELPVAIAVDPLQLVVADRTPLKLATVIGVLKPLKLPVHEETIPSAEVVSAELLQLVDDTEIMWAHARRIDSN